MPADEIDFRIVGDDIQAVIITLDPEEAVVAEAGAMMYMQDGIEMGTSLSMKEDGSGLMGKLFKAGKRMITGESFFITIFGNKSHQRREAAFAAPYPGRIIPIQLADFGGELICQKDAFLCGARGVDVDIFFQRKIGVGFFGGEGFILQRLHCDSPALAFLHAGGSIIEYDLEPGEVLRVDTGCLVAFEKRVDYAIEFVKGIKNKLFGGEGFFYATFRGPGRVYLQTLPFSRLADRVYAAAPQGGGKDVGEGSILGGIFRMVDGS